MAWQRAPEVVFEVCDGQALLVNPAGVELITLNEVGTLVWGQLDQPRELEELVAALAVRFGDVARRDLERDVKSFLTELSALALVTTGAGPAD